MQTRYGEINPVYDETMTALVQKAFYDPNFNLVLVAKWRNEYDGPEAKAGVYEGTWQNTTQYSMDVVFQMQRIEQLRAGVTVEVPTGIIKDCGHGPELTGKRIELMTWDKMIAFFKKEGMPIV